MDTGEAIRVNVGSGDRPIDGWDNIDRKDGREAYPLEYADGTVDEIRASHVFEHFGTREAVDVLSDWFRALKPGGRVRIAVPDAKRIAAVIVRSEVFDETEALAHAQMMGGQVNSDDYHKCSYTASRLGKLLEAVGFLRIGRWKGDNGDCSTLPVSLNLEAYKPGRKTEYKMSMLMSVPRLGFMDNMFCAVQATRPYGMRLMKYTGAYWHQCLERGLDERLADGDDLIFTCDYDTLFDAADIHALLQYMERVPDADAIFGAQTKRECGAIMTTVRDSNGQLREDVTLEEFGCELTPVASGHFGLTVLRASALRDVPKPWLQEKPAPDGSWNKGRIDADIAFWHNWTEAGKTLYQANRVRLGHLEMMAAWPDRMMTADYQYVTDYHEKGKPYTWL